MWFTHLVVAIAGAAVHATVAHHVLAEGAAVVDLTILSVATAVLVASTILLRPWVPDSGCMFGAVHRGFAKLCSHRAIDPSMLAA